MYRLVRKYRNNISKKHATALFPRDFHKNLILTTTEYLTDAVSFEGTGENKTCEGMARGRQKRLLLYHPNHSH
jgi:hypothetical protein